MKPLIKICMIGNPDSIHVQRWARHFSQRGYDVSLLSYYKPKTDFGGNPTVHFVRSGANTSRRPRSTAAMARFPGMLRLITATRLRAAGFYRELERINPDVVHAHYVSDYGFLAALSGRHPLVVSAWGSDLLVDPSLSAITRRVVRWVLSRADLVTYNADQLGDAALAMGAPPERLLQVVLGVGPEMLEALRTRSLPPGDRAPLILSQRSLERPLYNVDVVIRAMPEVLRRVPSARLVVGGEGALKNQLQALARSLNVAQAVDFAGTATWPDGLAERLGKAAVYVSVPSSEGTSVTMLEAMAAGAYPVVSDLPANREWVGGDNGAVVPVGYFTPLAEAIASALEDRGRRVSAAKHNRELIQARGLWDVNMARMEKAYRDLVRIEGEAEVERPIEFQSRRARFAGVPDAPTPAVTMKPPIKICLIGNPDSIHVRRWANHFSKRGFEISLLSYYKPRSEFGTNPTVHFIRERGPAGRRARSSAAVARFPGLLRVANATRLKASGFYRELERIDPDIVHAHYVSDYGLLAALSGRHPMVVSAWGSDLLVDPGLSAITRQLVRWVLQRADLITYDAEQVREVAHSLGAPPQRMLRVVLGVDGDLLGALQGRQVSPAEREPVILSLRSLERPLYNVDVIVQAMPAVLARVPQARLVIGDEGSLRPKLEALVGRLGVTHAVTFVGMARGPVALAQLLGGAAVYVSVPSSDGTSVTLLEAMTAGAYPIVSDLAANREWIGGERGTVVPAGQATPLAQAIIEALNDPARRATAAKRNLELVKEEGSWDSNMALMEDAYRSLVEGRAKVGQVNGAC